MGAIMFIDEKLKSDLQRYFAALTNKVKLLLITQDFECQYCRETRELLTELSAVSGKVELEIISFDKDKEAVAKYGADKIPATIILDKNGTDFGIKYYGIPSGYEFSSLLEDIIMVGTGQTQLPNNVVEKIKAIDHSVHLQVFVTPTCPYCPRAVLAAHKFAFLNQHIKADMVEATEFPHLSYKYTVKGVPRTVINEDDFIEGAAPEEMLLDKINKVLA